MAILNNNPLIGSGGQQGYSINNSVRLRSSASAYFNRTPASAGNRQKFTLSVWIKLGELGTNKILLSSNTTAQQFRIYTDNTIGFGNSGVANYQSTGVLRDPSAWYHIVCKVDTTLASGKIVIYVNNQAYLTTDGGLSLNANTQFNNTVAHFIGRDTETPNQMFFDGYMSEYNFIDGSAKTPSDFGETDTTTGVWKPKAYTGTYGTNGFYLKFSDIATTSGSNSGLGKDFSGNSNYWTTNNISVTAGTTYDAMTDSPTLTSATVANYCVLNPLDKSTNVTITEGNLRTTSSTSAWNATRGSFAVSSGKWYFEVTVLANTFASNGINVGVMRDTSVLTGASIGAFAGATTWGLGNNNGSGSGLKANNGTSSAYGATWTTNDVVGIAFDVDAGSIELYKNGVSQGVAYSSQSFGTVFPFVAVWSSDAAAANFGQRPFSYTPPTGYVRLNTFNLPDSTIKKGNKYMDATLYTGTGATQTITNAGSFRPDLVWVKVRSTTGTHVLTDSNRGANKQLFSNLTNAEASATNKITGFTSTGFTLGADDGTGTGDANFNGSTYVGWQWQAGQNSTSSNTSGSITSTVSVNTTAGFSVVTYTGTGATATVGHGLGVAPKMIIVKNRNDGTTNWAVYHVSTGANAVLFLNSTATPTTVSGKWGTPSSTTFGVNTAADVNANTQTMVAYCWAEIAGYSKFGSYTGNGSTDGTFVYLGFRPKFLLMKDTTLASDWYVYDTARDTYNAAPDTLNPNFNAVESGGRPIDVLSNGFKLRVGSGTNPNISGSTYIYAAFAENPFKNSLAR